MSKRDHDFITRSESKRRSNRTQGRKKLDRLLNVLIAIVAVLILINLYFVFSNNEEKTQGENDVVESNQSSENVATNDGSEDQNQSNSNESENNSTSNEEPADNSNSETNVNSEPNEENNTTNEKSNEESYEAGNGSENTSNNNSETIIVQASNDPVVDQVIIDPNWQVTSTNQTGQHVSTYEAGHIDYEEKKETIRNAVNLVEDNIIYWRIKNNGSSETAIAVVSSKDQSEKYRVSIEWIADQGWKPVKVELLNNIESAY